MRLIERREGFHDHIHPGAVWAVVPLESFRCDELTRDIENYPTFVVDSPPDDPVAVDRKIKLAVNRMNAFERGKILRSCGLDEIRRELWRRVASRVKPRGRKITSKPTKGGST